MYLKEFMYRRVSNFCSLPLFCFLVGCENFQNKEIELSSTGLAAYELVEGWPKLPDGHSFGNVTGLDIDSAGNLWIFHRGSRVWPMGIPMHETKIVENTITKIDKNSGEIAASWGANIFIMPHGLAIDKEDNLWVTDVGLHQIFKFNSKGELLMALGEAKSPGNDQTHFNLPTDVAVTSDGSFYVSDGYGNSRVLKFSSKGAYLFEWGSKGQEKGEFHLPHGIDLDTDGNVYVADRENNRIQKFDAEGNFLTTWQNRSTDQFYSVTIDHNREQLFGIDYEREDGVIKGSDIFRFDLDLNLQVQFGRTSNYTGPIARYHDICVDQEGNIYVGDILLNMVQKLRVVR